MLTTIPYGELTPDIKSGLIMANNVWTMQEGYRPARGLVGFTPALAGILGGCAYVSSTGEPAMLGGNATTLQRYTGGAWVELLGTLTATSWRFDQFLDLIIGVNGGAPIKFDFASGTASALGGSPPDSDLVATVRDQVFLAGDPNARNVLTISGYQDAEGYTPGTNQSLSVPFPVGGEIMGLAGGETGLILQKRSITRATYTGDATVWQFDEIARDIGPMAKGSVAQSGQTVFFLSEQGFKACDRNSVVPIGDEKIDREFFGIYSRADIANIQAAVDPRTTTVVWAMPGNPGRLWAYNWSRARWTTIDMSNRGIFSGFTANIDIDHIDAAYPGGLDNLPYSLDSEIFAGGNPIFMIIANEGVVGTMSGDNLPARFKTQPLPIDQIRRFRLRDARPICDATLGTVSIDARARAGDAPNIVSSGAIRSNGSVSLRGNGFCVGVIHDIPSTAWTYCKGVQLQGELEGWR